MKKMITFVFLLALFIGERGTAQKPGDSKPLASTHSSSGMRELRHEKKVHRRDLRLTKKNERLARHKQKDTYSLKFGGRKKRPKNKEKNKEKKGTATIGDSQVKK